jgi:superfamily II DNA or RNA helicase
MADDIANYRDFFNSYLWDILQEQEKERRLRERPVKAMDSGVYERGVYGPFSENPPIDTTAFTKPEERAVEKTEPVEGADLYCKPKQQEASAQQSCDANPLAPFCRVHEHAAKEGDDVNDRADDADQGEPAASAESAGFDYPGTPDTEVEGGKRDDLQFNKKWTSCFAGPSQSSCPCNFTYFNDRNPSEPQCSYKPGKKTTFLPQQRIVSEYMAPQAPYRGLLCYHGLGSGKTLLMVSVIARYLQDDPSRTIVVLVKPSLVQNFYDDLAKVDSQTLYGEQMDIETMKERNKDRINVVTFQAFANRLNGITGWDLGINKKVARNVRSSTGGDTKSMPADGLGALPDGEKKADSDAYPLMNNTIVMIDEAHNLVTPKDAGYPPENDAYSVLSSIRRADTCRIILLTATPMRNEPFEIGILLNILKKKTSVAEQEDGAQTRSRVANASQTTLFPQITHQTLIGSASVDVVDMEATKSAFEDMFYQTVNGVQTIKNEDLFIQKCKGLVSFFPVDNMFTKFARKQVFRVDVPLDNENYRLTRERMVSDFNKIQTAKKRSCFEIKTLCATSRRASDVLGAYEKDIVRRVEANKAPKIAKIVEVMGAHAAEGKQFAYSFFDQAIIALTTELTKKGWKKITAADVKLCLKPEHQNFRSINHPSFESIFTLPLADPKCARSKEMATENDTVKRFFILGSDTDSLWKEKLMKMVFNLDSNKTGSILNLCIGNKKYSEGISLFAIRNLHVTEAPSSTGLLDQIIGRGVRNCSHRMLSFPVDWNVNVFMYYGTHTNTSKFIIEGIKAYKQYDDEPVGNASGNEVADQDASAKKPRKLKPDKLNEWCAANVDEGKCNASDFCSWQDGKCTSLGMDDMIHKMAITQSRMYDRFLELMQLSAVDCNTFKQLHDNPNRVCFMADPSNADADYEETVRHYTGFNQPETYSALPNPDSRSEDSDAAEVNMCEELPPTSACMENRKCFVDTPLTGKRRCVAKPEAVGTNHGKCRKYYGQNKYACTRDPMCRWSPTAGADGGCMNRYIENMEENTMAIEDSAETSPGHLRYIVHKLEESTIQVGSSLSLDDIASVFEGNNDTPASSLPSMLHTIYQHVLLRGLSSTVTADDVKHVFEKHYAEHPAAWYSVEVRALLAKLASHIAQQDMDNSASSGRASSVSVSNLETTISTHTARSRHSLADMWNKKWVRVVHYTFCIKANNALYYFHSRDRDDAPLYISGIGRLSKVVKYIEMHDISVRCTFHISLQCIDKIELQWYLWTDSTRAALEKLANHSSDIDRQTLYKPPVHTSVVVNNHQNTVVDLLDNARCGALWKAEDLPEQLTYQCEDKEKVIKSVDELKTCQLKQSKNSKKRSGEIIVPGKGKGDVLAIQANNCYYGWLSNGRARPKWWRKHADTDTINVPGGLRRRASFPNDIKKTVKNKVTNTVRDAQRSVMRTSV